MKVLHITSVFPTEERPEDGVFISSQIDSLKRIGIEVDVYVIKGKWIFKYLVGIFRLKKIIQNKNYDILHAHYMYTGWTARLASKLPLIISFMGSDVFGEVDINGNYKFASRIIHKSLSNLLLSISDLGIVKSFNLANQFKKKEKLKIIPNGVDTTIFYPSLKSEKETLGLSANKKYILFAGVPERKEKRFDLALKAFDILKEKLENIDLIFLKNKKPSEVAAYLNACDCLLLTSIHEGSPNIVKEALACNLPIVSVNVGDIEERILGVENCYIVSSNPMDIANKLFAIIEQSQRANNGYNKISTLKLDIIAKEIGAMYNRML